MTFAITIYLTALQIEEIAHKADILASEPDLQESYEVTQEQADAFAERFRTTQPAAHSLSVTEAQIIAGELDNAAAIALEAFQYDGDKQALAAYRSFKGVVKKLADYL